MKGIILAGGIGSRLYPVTKGTSKHLLPIYDKPMIFYPIATLMLANIKDILIISSVEHVTSYKKLLGDGSKYGININYSIQDKPKGIADSFLIGEEFIGKNDVCLILGDNIFYGEHFSDKLISAYERLRGAAIFAYYVNNPEDFGVIEFENNGKPKKIIEKPKNPNSNYAVTGIYLYKNSVVEHAKKLKPSKRNELEISDINDIYLREKKLDVNILGRGFAWLDTGTSDSLLEASQFVRTIEKRQGLKIACLEEIALNKGWITIEEIMSIPELKINNSYYNHVKKLIYKN
jgi:glucose-1-phosphate thymidylyltransferase